MVKLIAMILVIIGGLNWGLVGITNILSTQFNLVEFIFTYSIGLPIITDIIYIIVGLAAIVAAITMMKK